MASTNGRFAAMIIDAHCHLFDANARDRYFWLDGQPEGHVPPEQYEQCILAQPVDHVLLSADPGLLKAPEGLARANDLVAQAAQAHPARISGLCQVNPHLLKESLDEIDKHAAKGNFVGIGEICQHVLEFDTCDERVYPMIERAIELDVPVQYHSSAAEHTSGIDKLAAQFPRAKFLMAHIGGMYNWPNGIDVARRHDNVWVDTSGWVMLALGAMKRALDELGPAQILFAVDYPLIETAALVAALEILDVSNEDRERMAWRNTAELFGLDIDASAPAPQGG
jgi:predicted TIM-barrel fold metal-dependent hydrolase